MIRGKNHNEKQLIISHVYLMIVS